ncbi:MAG: bifunctional [glutamate--ammonia ligase]-adenylyl-L-tyrosine phosphorylase/[glutamate--ammonia-ligase] adenylyltransferase [Magnetococcales bacterium]|nr:bifunctional [glutamate--ammonia ligase]-adenylyl-L-tyrosine phosphorylase/[glutamate--ammonia-ligase] adenylyltransferase [Magnetococcales bacterium]
MDGWQKLLETLALDQEGAARLLREAEATAEPERVGHWLSDMMPHVVASRHFGQRLSLWLSPPGSCKGLITVLGNSPFLAHLIKKWPEFLDADPGTDGYRIPSPGELTQGILTTTSWDEAASYLRRNKQRAYFFIGFNDLTGIAPFSWTVHSLSDLAQSSLEAAYRWLDRYWSQRLGAPMVGTGHELQPARFCILGMGKLGARELNFSSDIDLIYLYDDDQGQTLGPKQMAIKGYYNRLGQDLIRLLSQTTEDGMVFRVDLRLRPEGESGDLTLSRRSAEIYYESWGQTWERSAMIKARPVAGDLALGATFLKNIEPFIFRRYLDFTALDAIRQMKLKIDRKTSGASDHTRNVKLGYGGIREIEFFVQSQQLIHGGKIPQLRHSETLMGLRHLSRHGLLADETARTLEEAYLFLRTLEHRLQIECERQTHSLPEDPVQFGKVAKRMGMADAVELRQRFSQITHTVHAIYDSLFFDGKPEQSLEQVGWAQQLLQHDLGSPEGLQMLATAGLTPPESAAACIRILRDGPRGVALTEHDRLWYGRVALVLLQGILKAPDPNLALHHMGEFLKSLGHRVSYLAMLYENNALLSLLLRLFGTSGFLSHFLIRNPYMLDHLISADFMEGRVEKNKLQRELTQRLQTVEHPEERFEALRIFKNAEMLKIGIRDLSGVAENDEVMFNISILAEVILEQVLKDAMDELVQRHGEPQYFSDGVRKRAPFAIIAMGKLGGRELNYASDLDLIFIHGSEGERPWTSGSNSLDNAAFFSRLGQRVISHITTLTRNGLLYELDMRLRPSGQSGPLVTSLESFIHYHRHESWLWEHQALIRARFVAGDPELGTRTRDFIREVVLRRRSEPQVFAEVGQMRQRIFQEKAPPSHRLDLKQSMGGIVDIEFLVQALILAHGAAAPHLLQHHCGRALRTLDQAGLFPENFGTILREAYDFFLLVENRLRLLHNRSENRIPDNVTERDRLARLCQMDNGEQLQNSLRTHMQRVSDIVHYFFRPMDTSNHGIPVTSGP